MRKLGRFSAFIAMVALTVPMVARSSPLTVATPIPTTAPSWYTPALHAKVLAAGIRGVALPEGVEVPASSVAFLGIRPGQLIIVENPDGFSLCTSNFVFHDGANFAIGTAGHCGRAGDAVTMLYAPGVLVNIGTITSSTGDAGVGNDFALISIKAELNGVVSPAMAWWGGPKDSYNSTGAPLVVKHAGWGLVVGTGGTPRIGVGVSYDPAGEWRFEGVIVNGDSGSGAVDGAGSAIGNITHIVVDSRRTPFVWNAGTSIAKISQLAGLPLATCASPIPWPLFGCPTV